MIDYCVLDGIVFMDLTLNHTNVNNILICNIKSKKDRIKNKIVISSIINLKIINNSIIKEGLILTKINNIPIIDINDMKNKIKDFMKNEYIELYFENKLKYRISVKDMIKNDKELSKNHKYDIYY
jgi:S1-C subfamily serine protease